MLIVNVINTLPNIEDRKIEDFDDFLSEIDDRKERKKEIIFINKRAKRARYVVRRPYFLPYYLNIVSAPADCLTKETFRHNGNTIKYLKSPFVDAGDF